MRKLLAFALVFSLQSSYASTPPSPQEFNQSLNKVEVINKTVKESEKEVSESVKETVKEHYYDVLKGTADKIRDKEKNPQAYLEVVKEEGKEAVQEIINQVQETVINIAVENASQAINAHLEQIFGEKIGGFLGQFTKGLLLGKVTPEKVLKEGLDKILDVLADKVEGLGFPPKVNVGLKKVINVGGKQLPGYNKTDAQTVGLEGTLNIYPNPFIQDKCMKEGEDSLTCQLLYSLKTEEFAGVCVYSSINQPYEEIKKDLTQSVVVASSGSALKVLAPGAEQIQKKRVEMMTRAVFDSSSVPAIGKKAVEKVPQPLKLKYAKVASDGAFRDAYLKSLQRRLIIHYSALIALHKEIEMVCSMSQPPTLENCSVGGSLVGSLSGLLSGGGVESALSQVSSLSPESLASSVESISNPQKVLANLQSQANSVLKEIQKQKEQAVNTINELNKSFNAEGRGACCGVCGEALAQARANASLIKSSTSAILAGINSAADKIVQAISIQQCMTRNTIRTEMAQTRNFLLTLKCMDYHLKERQLLLEIDQLESEVAQAGALMSLMQNQEFKKLRSEYVKLVAKGVE